MEEELHKAGCRTYVFDGDNVRHGLCGDLGFSAADRQENIRRIGEMVKLFTEAGEIRNYTGISAPYEEPEDADLLLDTGTQPLAECVGAVMNLLQTNGVIKGIEPQ